MTGWIESHCHLQDPRFSPDRLEVLARAHAAGVQTLVVNATAPADWADVLRLAEHPGVLPFLGVHPWYVDSLPENWLEDLRTRVESAPVGVGEIGLDRWKNLGNFATQEDVFRKQFELARELDRPVTIHCLKAWGWLERVVDELGPGRILLHAYGGPVELISPWIRRGAFFSFGGYALHPRKERMRAAFRAVPLDRLCLESDAPDMPPPPGIWTPPSPSPDSAQRNEPAALPAIAKALAEIRGIPPDQLMHHTSEATRRWLGTALE